MSSPAHSKTCSFRAEDLFPSVVTNQTMQNFTVRQATEAKLKHIKVDGDNNGKCIDAFALLKVVTDVEHPKRIKRPACRFVSPLL